MAATAAGSSSAIRIQASRDASGQLHLDSQPTAAINPKSVASIFAAKCGNCHNAAKKDGGLDLSDLSKLDSSYEFKILDRLTTADPAKRMPKGGTLTAEELITILRSSSAASAAAVPAPPKASP